MNHKKICLLYPPSVWETSISSNFRSSSFITPTPFPSSPTRFHFIRYNKHTSEPRDGFHTCGYPRESSWVFRQPDRLMWYYWFGPLWCVWVQKTHILCVDMWYHVCIWPIVKRHHCIESDQMYNKDNDCILYFLITTYQEVEYLFTSTFVSWRVTKRLKYLDHFFFCRSKRDYLI